MTPFLRSTCLICSFVLVPAAAWADCEQVTPTGPVLCDGGDGDGFFSPVPGLTVDVRGTVTGPGTALELTGANATVSNVGTISGSTTGVFGPSSLTVTNSGFVNGGINGIDAAASLGLVNSGTVTGGTGAAVSTVADADVRNLGGTLRGLSGSAMTSTFGLNLVNIGGEITGLGSTATVQAGRAATVINGAGGEIGAGTDSAIAAAEDLGLENLGRIASGGRAATIDAGANAGITNGDGGQITNRVGSAITATIGLTLVNQPGGTISGGARYTVDAGIMADVTNRGTITGLPDGILLGPASRLTNAPGGLIEGIDTAIAAADGSIRIVNEPGARIRSTLAETIRFGRGVGHDFTNRGRVSADRGAALDVTEVLRFRLDNTRLGEITSRSAEAIVIRRTQETQLVNDGALEAELEAIAQSGGRLDLTNRRDGSIRSDSATAVVAEVLRLENAAGASIVGETGGIRMDSGSVDNEGRVEAAGTAAAIFVEASAETAQVTNRGVVSGGTGIRFDADHSGTREVTNAGTITAFDGVAIDFAAGLGQSLLRVQGSSRILGDVRFGASDDILEIGDITAGQLIDGRFEGGGGMDLVRFGTHDLASDAMSFAFHDGVMVEIAFRAGNGDVVSGQFRDFEFFDFGGGPRSFAELQGMGSDPLAPIPVPAALPMLLAGIAAFLGLRRRGARRAAAV